MLASARRRAVTSCPTITKPATTPSASANPERFQSKICSSPFKAWMVLSKICGFPSSAPQSLVTGRALAKSAATGSPLRKEKNRSATGLNSTT